MLTHLTLDSPIMRAALLSLFGSFQWHLFLSDLVSFFCLQDGVGSQKRYQPQ